MSSNLPSTINFNEATKSIAFEGFGVDRGFISEFGFATFNALDDDDLIVTQGILAKKINCNKLPNPTLGSLIEAWGGEEHDIFSIKKNRIFTCEEAEQFFNLRSIKKIEACFPGYRYGSVVYGQLEGADRPETYFRIVRPNESSDVGPLHADLWFNQLYETSVTPLSSFKIWISIQTEPGLNGLSVVPKSHLQLHSYVREESCDGPRPKPKDSVLQLEEKLLLPAIYPGQAIVFPDTTLHKGVVNKGVRPRVSIEIGFFKV